MPMSADERDRLVRVETKVDHMAAGIDTLVNRPTVDWAGAARLLGAATALVTALATLYWGVEFIQPAQGRDVVEWVSDTDGP